MRFLFNFDNILYLILLSSMQVDTSTRGSEVDSECVMDFTSEFTTYEVTLVILKLWVHSNLKVRLDPYMQCFLLFFRFSRVENP